MCRTWPSFVSAFTPTGSSRSGSVSRPGFHGAGPVWSPASWLWSGTSRQRVLLPPRVTTPAITAAAISATAATAHERASAAALGKAARTLRVGRRWGA